MWLFIMLFIIQNSKLKMQNFNQKFKTDLRTRCYRFSLKVIAMVDSLPNNRISWIISDQLIRSATSIGANLIEARASSSRLEFKRYNETSLKSANETKYWLELIKDAELANQEVINNLLEEVTELANMLASGIIKLKNLKF